MRNWSDVLPESVAIEQKQWERNQAIWRAYQELGTCREVGAAVGVSAGRITQIVARCKRHKREGWRSPIERFLARCEVYPSAAKHRQPKRGLSWRHFLHDQPGYGRRRRLYDDLNHVLSYSDAYWRVFINAPTPQKWQTTGEYAAELLRWFDAAETRLEVPR